MKLTYLSELDLFHSDAKTIFGYSLLGELCFQITVDSISPSLIFVFSTSPDFA